MATEEELNNARDLRDIEEDRLGISGQLLESIREANNVTLENVRNLSLQRQEKQDIRDISRSINKIAKDSFSLTAKDLGSTKNLAKIQKDQVNLQAKIALSKNIIETLSRSTVEAEREAAFALEAQVIEAEKLSAELEIIEETAERVANNLGVKTFSALEDITQAIPGLRILAGPFKEAAQAAREIAIETDSSTKAFAAGAKVLTNQLLIGGALKVLDSLLSINKSQTDFRRLTGESAKEVGLLNDGLLTSIDLIKTQVALTEQFGLNASAAFSNETLQEVGELTKAVGLTAEEAGNFARFSEITGTNLNEQLDTLSKSVPKAFSQKQILSETANVSSDIALAMGNSAYEIGQAVIQAKQLGLSLSDVNGIADSLLDIEQSLTAEFEAEVITGKQINLERARGFALQNNLAGLTEEIKNNEDLIKGFATANRIEQEAIAKTLGMSRQQMADMVMSSKLVNTLTEEQRANAAGVSIEQLKQLDINQSIDDSINKITQSLAGPLEKFAQLLQYTIQISDYIVAGASGLLLYNNYLKISTALKKKNIALTTMEGLKSAGVAAIEAIKSVVKTPIIGPALAAAAGVGVYSLAKSYMSKGDDVMSEGGYGNRTLMGPKGSIALNNEDTVIAGTNLFPKDKSSERNAPTNVTVTLSQTDIKAIASAVREGASQATINLDGDRVSNRLQPSLAVNTRRYSV